MMVKLYYSHDFGCLSFDDENGTQTIISMSINVQMSMQMPMRIGVRTIKLSFYRDVTKFFISKHSINGWVLKSLPIHYRYLLDDVSLEIFCPFFSFSGGGCHFSANLNEVIFFIYF